MTSAEQQFQNTRIAFAYKTNKELKKAWYLFKAMSNQTLVNAGAAVLRGMVSAGLPVAWAVRPTVFGHFCGGTTIGECEPVVKQLARFKVRSILDYSVEGGTNIRQIEKALQETLATIKNAAVDPNVPFAVFKPTAFAGEGLFEHADRSVQLTDEMHAEYNKFQERVETLCREAYEHDVPIMIDAEDSWYQYLVDETVEKMMEKYNHQRAIVFNTLQMYRHDRLEYLKKSIDAAREKGHFYGVKFVRGAYMEKERERAEEKGYPSPIQPDKAATDRDFNAALLHALDNIDITTIFCGTHNEDSCFLLSHEMDARGLARDDKRIWFSQLYGMSDHISFNLANAGYNVAKYIPFGPVKTVMPYLIRRAEENTSIAGQTSRELRLIEKEMKRRKKADKPY